MNGNMNRNGNMNGNMNGNGNRKNSLLGCCISFNMTLITFGLLTIMAGLIATYTINCAKNKNISCINCNPSNPIIYNRYIKNKTDNNSEYYSVYLDTTFDMYNLTKYCSVWVKNYDSYEEAEHKLNECLINSTIQVVKFSDYKCDLYLDNMFVLRRARIFIICGMICIAFGLIIFLFQKIARCLEELRYKKLSGLKSESETELQLNKQLLI